MAEKQRREFPYIQHPVSSIIHTLRQSGQWVTMNEPIANTLIMNQCLLFSQVAFVFSSCLSSVPGSHPGHNVTLSRCGSSGSSWLWKLLRLSSFFKFILLTTLTALSGATQVFCGISLYWNLSDVFLMILWVLRVWGRKRDFHHTLSRIYT